MTFQPQNCHVLALGKFYNITYTEKYTLHRQELEKVFEQKDIGVILDPEVKFDKHISVKVKNVNAIAGLICRTFSYLDGPLCKKSFSTFVRPHLEYGQVIWTPHLKQYLIILKNLQRLKIGGWFSSHELLRKAKKLNLRSLVYRRALGISIEIFKHFHSYDDSTPPENFRPRYNPSRKHNYQLV